MGTTRKYIGLMSGTSCDAVDAALVDIDGQGLDMTVRYLAHTRTPYPQKVHHALMEIMAPARTRTEQLAQLNAAVGRVFATCAQALMRDHKLKSADVAAIGSHGQTICHIPDDEEEPATLQIGEAAIIAAETGLPVVADFRQNDLALGGQGAPLVPWTDFVLFGATEKVTCVQNIGGIGNVTCLRPGASPNDIVAFDTGPGCMVIDELVRRISRKQHNYDRDGRFARRGHPDQEIAEQVLQLPFFRQAPPKCAGREQFGKQFVNGFLRMLQNRSMSTYDKIATATFLTARSISNAYREFLHLDGHCRVVLCGGGALNQTLVNMLTADLPGIEVQRVDQFGIPLQAKECVSFAMLAAAALQRVPVSLPQVTGARRSAVLGKITRL
jgi:anhydro-N-acetylmuramic acid kinase